MPSLRVLALAAVLSSSLASFSVSAQTFAAELGWVPIGGAEREAVAGDGDVTATLTGSRLEITGSFEGLPALRAVRCRAPLCSRPSRPPR